MKFIKVSSFATNTLPSKKFWVTRAADAAKTRKALTDAGYKRADIVTEEVDIVLNKTGVLVFLNGGKA